MRPGPAGRLDRQARRGQRQGRAGGAEPVQGHHQDTGRQERPGDRHRRLPRRLRRPRVHRPRRAGAGNQNSGPFGPARGRACRQRHHDGLSLARRPCRRPRRRQPGAHRGRGRGFAPIRHAAARRPAAARCLRRQDRARHRHRRRRDRPRALDRRRAQPHFLCGRRHVARHCQAAHGEDRLPAARHARLHHADRRGDRVLRGDPQGQEAVGPARHRGDLAAAARGVALRRAGAGAAAQAAAAERGRLLRVRHPRGPGLQPAVGDRAPQGPAPVVLCRVCAPALAVRRPRLRAVRLERCPVRAAGPQGDRGGAAPAPRRLPALRHQLARAPRLPRRAEPDPDRARGAGRHRPSRPRLPGARQLLPPHRHQRRRGCRGQGQAVRAAQGDRVEKALQARPHRRGGDPRRPHAVDRPPRHHRRDAAVLRAQQAGADRAQSLCGLDGERLRRRFAALAGLLEREPEIRIKA